MFQRGNNALPVRRAIFFGNAESVRLKLGAILIFKQLRQEQSYGVYAEIGGKIADTQAAVMVAASFAETGFGKG